MEWGLFILLWAVVQALLKIARTRSSMRVESLCLVCTNAVVTHGRRGQLMVACNLQGAMRPVKFAVCQCTGFCVTRQESKLVTIEGFVPDKRQVYEEVAIR